MNRWLMGSLLLTLAAFSASLVVYFGLYDQLPERVPIHWNLEGKPDGFIPREQSLGSFLLVPGFLVVWVLLSLALPWLSPQQFSVEGFRPTYDYIMALCSLLFAYMHGVLLLAALQVKMDFNLVFLGGIFLVLAALGNVLGKVRRNFWVGVRTPWTLASETVWTRTHRLAAWTFVAGSLLGFVLLLLGSNPLISLGAFGVLALVPVVYSLVLYKRLEREGKLDPPA